jgi:hypothetical protein
MNQTMNNYLINDSSGHNLFLNLSKNSSNFVADSLKNVNNTTIIILQSDPTKIDPNWFYSSSAQCAAAIVGLMGAFLVTKLLNQKAFANQLNNEISDYKNKIELINKDITPKIEFIKDFDFENECNTAKEFLESVKSYINPDNPLSLDKVYEIAKQSTETKNITKKAFEHEYNEEYLAEVRKTAEELVDECFNNSDAIEHIDVSNPPDAQTLYDTVTKEKKYRFMSKSIFEKKYKKFIEKRKKERSFSIFDTLQNYKDVFSLSSSRPVISRHNIENGRLRLEKYSSYKDEVAIKKAEILYYEQIIIEKEKLLEFNEELPSLKNNIISLFIFSVLGVFLPLYMLLLDNDTMLEYRFFILILIFIGWVLILYNLGLEIWGLTRKKSLTKQ